MISIGSKASGSRMRKAMSTALGKDAGSGAPSAPRRPRGSMEGYDGGRSTYIHMNGTGYDSISSVRNKKPFTDLSMGVPSNPVGRSGIINMNVFDYRMAHSSTGSQAILKRRMGLDSI